MSLSIKLGNFLYRRAFPLYRPLYGCFKRRSDAAELALLREHVKAGQVVLDIGANIGFYAEILSGLVGQNGRVHCFEPDRKNFSYLKQAIEGLPNVSANNRAVGPKTDTLKIYTSKNLNVDHRTYEPDDYDEVLEIEAVSIDDYVKGGKVDFIKMDIQGFEMQAVSGMERTLADNSKIQLISEFWPYGLRAAGSSTSEYYDFLCARGFRCFLLKDRSLEVLTPAMVKSLDPLGSEQYFNIFASRA
jgi:FkbM family methyltransferase